MPRKRGKVWYADFSFDGVIARRYRVLVFGPKAVEAETRIQHDSFKQRFGPPKKRVNRLQGSV